MKSLDIANALEPRILRAENVLPESFNGFHHGAVSLANASRFVESYFNQPLTSYAVGWRDPASLEAELEFFAPAVPVPRYFTYAEFTHKEQFLGENDDSDIRAIGGEFKDVKAYTSSKTTAKTDNKGLSICVDLDEVADKQGWEEMYTSKLLQRLNRIELRRAIALLSAAATNTAKTWDTTAGKDPDHDVHMDLITSTTARGIPSNRVGYGETAWGKRRLAHRAQNTAGGFGSAGMTEAQVAQYLGVDQVLVSKARYTSSASALAEVVSNLVLMFNALSGVDTEDPANIKRFVSNTDTGGRVKVFTQQISAKRYMITVEHYSLIKITSTLGIRQFTVS